MRVEGWGEGVTGRNHKDTKVMKDRKKKEFFKFRSFVSFVSL